LLLTGATIGGCALDPNSDLEERWQRAKQQGFNDFRNGQLQAAIGHYNRALDFLRKRRADDPRIALTQIELARVYAAQNQYEYALQVYSDAQALLSKQPACQQEDAQANATATAALNTSDPQPPSPPINAGAPPAATAVNAGAPPAATPVNAGAPPAATSPINVGARHAARGDDKELITGLSDAEEGIALALQKLGRDADAEQWYRQAFKVAYINQLGQPLNRISIEYEDFLKTHGRSEEADKLAHQLEARIAAATPLPSQDEQLKFEIERHRREAEAAEKRRLWFAAEQEYREALRLSDMLEKKKTSADIAVRLGQMYITSGNTRAAERAYRLALSVYKRENASPLLKQGAELGLVSCLHGLGKDKEAERVANELVADARLEPGPNQVQLFGSLGTLGTILITEGKFSQAADALNESYSIARRQSNICSPLCTLSMCYVSNAQWLAGDKTAFARTTANFVQQAATHSTSDRSLSAKLLNDFAEECLKSKHPDEAAAYVEIARHLLRGVQSAEQTARCADILKRCKQVT
jgi:tetratricopeptide (TPR) repeat protein